MASVFRGTMDFFDTLGIFDVVLPFLLVFTVMFAILDKTKIFGTVTIEGIQYTKKNLNAIVAFAISFFVVASSKLVEVITKVSSQMVILLLLVVFFLILIGTFFKEGEDVALFGGWRTFFMIFMFAGVILIFADAIKTETGESWLQWIINYIINNFSSHVVASIILLLVMVGFIFFVTMDKKPDNSKKKDNEG